MAGTTGAAVEKYLREKRATGRISRTTETQHRRVLHSFIGHCPQRPGSIRRRDVLRWLNTIRGLAAGTRRFYFTTARGFTTWLMKRDVLKKDPFADVQAPKVPQPLHRALDRRQVGRLVAACETGRERAVILLAFHTGLRRAELAALEVGDVSLASRSLLVREGKGGSSREVPLSDEAARVVGDYMAQEGLRAGPLFRSEVCPERGVSPQTVWRVFDAVAKRSGVKVRPGDGIACHAARHTCATELHAETGDVVLVQTFLGHADLASTQIYVGRLGLDRMRDAVAGRSYLGGVA